MAEALSVLFVATHPVQYAAPQLQVLAADPRVEVTVAFLSLGGAVQTLDPHFGVPVKWDIPLLDGYRWVHPKNVSPRPSPHTFIGLLNPGLWKEVQRGYDIVVCFGYRAASFWIAAVSARFAGAGLVWTTDATSLAPRGGGRWKARLKQQVLPPVFRSGTGVLAPSSKSAEFVRSLGVQTDRVFMTPYVVDNGFFAERARTADAAAARRTWGVRKHATVAAFVGKLVPWKRPADLLHAVASVPDVDGVFAGDGPERPSLELLARRLGIEDRVRFLGFVNQTTLPTVYAASDVLILPSSYEPFGLVVNEAFATGTPAIVSLACGSAYDLVRDDETGYTFAPGDVEALTTHLRAVSSDETLRARLGDGARRRIAEWDLSAWREATVTALLEVDRLRRRSR